MNDIVYLNVQRIMKILLITIQPVLLFSLLFVFFPTITFFQHISFIFMVLVINEILVLFLSIRAALKIKGKEYLESTFYHEFGIEYDRLNTTQKALYYYSRLIEKRLNVAPIYNKSYEDHFYFVVNDKQYYSIIVKDYFGTILSDTKSQVWKIKYKDKIREVNNPFHLNKRVMDSVHLSDYKSIENIVIISERTRLEKSKEGIYYLGNFLYKMK